MPRRVVANHGVESGDDFSDASGECDLFVFAGLKQSLVEAFDRGVVADSDHRAEVEGGT